ncbi:MAG: Six-hairpin glycosidase-like protein [Rudaea sp.]|uniref:MGH1-like glycoside hydrolase domain-containing protein n=1 Tax=unclassified Rudaea TaxID=2627037 RepID=UPI0010F55B83|nr:MULTISPECIES: Six-hairpin glycosidase-like protein [unclassified Rudaea]MBN8887002.1 Six-hairpin glycosidase-like protein [Rudaea sp.]
MILKAVAATALLTSISAAAAVADTDGFVIWQNFIAFENRHAGAAVEKAGYRLDSNGTARTIPMQAMRSETASPIVDALFALAQVEADGAKTKALTDGAYNHGKPIACDCFVTGVKWPFVWTRDSAYSIDLGLAWLDPARSRRTLDFKLSDVREASAQQGLYVVQDTGSGGSWPISTDRVAWFLGARRLLDDKAFADKTYKALKDTLAQDKQYVFDAQFGLYRGETSFLDWREQTYPVWTEKNVRFIAESFALSTNVLHYEALRLAATMAQARNDAAAAQYRNEADALRAAIDHRFWREDRGLYMSYIGPADGPQTIEAYDLLGTSLAILADIPAPDRARKALANYPTWPAGSPVIWPEHRDAAIYHNRAIWPFVSAYALRAARKLDDGKRIAHELLSILRGAALSGSNYENYELVSGAVHVEDGKWSGPVVNSPRQLWSIAAMLDAVVQGVFGVDGDKIEPKIPAELVPMLFGTRNEIRLHLADRDIVLVKPAHFDQDNLLVAGETERKGKNVRVQLRSAEATPMALRFNSVQFAPDTPEIIPTAPKIADGSHAPVRFWLDGKPVQTWKPGSDQALKSVEIADTGALQSLWTTRVDPTSQLESLPGPIVRLGQFDDVGGAWPRTWTPTRDGRYQLRLGYENPHGPINTGVTAAVKTLAIDCGGEAKQSAPLVMPHTVAKDLSTAAAFTAKAGKKCTFTLEQGFNMSFLSRNRLYTGEQGGEKGPVNDADYGTLRIVPLP